MENVEGSSTLRFILKSLRVLAIKVFFKGIEK